MRLFIKSCSCVHARVPINDNGARYDNKRAAIEVQIEGLIKRIKPVLMASQGKKEYATFLNLWGRVGEETNVQLDVSFQINRQIEMDFGGMMLGKKPFSKFFWFWFSIVICN